MKIAILVVAGQGVMWFLAWRLWTYRSQPEPEAVLHDVVFCFFFWWLLIPIGGYFALNERVTAYVTHRRACAVQKAEALKSGQENGLYD